MDSAYYAARVIAAIRRVGALFSVTVPMDPKVKAAIAAIPRGRLDGHQVSPCDLG